MLRLQINLFFIILYVFLFVSCDYIDILKFVNLKQIEISIEPEENNSILPDLYSPIILKFSTEMKKRDTENLLQVISDSGSVRGDKYWIDNELYFVPVSGWTAGSRYNLSLYGTLQSIDGRETRIEHYKSFYVINKNNPPLLEWFYPLNDTSVSTNDLILEFHFSASMDRLAVETGLILEGIGNKTYEWEENDKILKIIPDKALLPWNFYRWNLKDSIKCINGVPLPKSYNGNFTTDLDKTLPFVEDVYPVLFSDGCWFPTGTDIETGLRQGQGIAVIFNKPMSENVIRSIRFEPSLSGRTEYLSDRSVVYIFSREPEPYAAYTLIISGDTRDCEGLKLGEDIKVSFIADIPVLNILAITANEGIVIDNLLTINNAVQIPVSPATGELSLSIWFSLPFNSEEKQNTPQKINIYPVFPRTLSPVALQYVSWISDDRLFIRWEGLSAGSGEISHYYRFTIPGGRGGVTTDKEIFFKEDITFYLEAIR